MYDGSTCGEYVSGEDDAACKDAISCGTTVELEDDVMRQKVDTWAEMCRRGDSNLS